MGDVLQFTFYGNTVLRYLIFLVSLPACVTLLRVFTKLIMKTLRRNAEKSKKKPNEALEQSIRKYLVPVLYFVAVLACLKILTLTPAVQNVVDAAVKVFFAFYGGYCLTRAAAYFLTRYWKRRKHAADGKVAFQWINGAAKFLIWSVVTILFLQNIGVKIDALIAGLGVGGLAVAFAAQVVLEDVFCFFTIIFDRPFETGDFIIAGEQMGTVEHIGVKTTRLRAPDGEQLILSNKDMTSSRIRNFKTMEQRRVVFRLGVTYDTDAKVLAEIPDILKEAIDSVENASFARAHFVSFGASSLDFEIAYHVLSSDFDRYMEVHHQINLKIKDEFDQRGIAFAFPTQTIYVAGGQSTDKKPGYESEEEAKA